jgi:hypothetical protein
VVVVSLVIQVMLVVAVAAADWRLNEGKPLWTSFSMYAACAHCDPYGASLGVEEGQGC